MLSKALLFFNLALAATAITNPQKVKAVAASSRPQAYQSKVLAGLYQLYPQDKSGAVSDQGGDTLVSTMWTRGAAGNQIVSRPCLIETRDTDTSICSSGSLRSAARPGKRSTRSSFPTRSRLAPSKSRTLKRCAAVRLVLALGTLLMSHTHQDKAVAVGSRGRAPTKWQFRFLNRAKYNRDCFQVRLPLCLPRHCARAHQRLQILIPGVNLAWTSADPSLNKTDPAVEPRVRSTLLSSVSRHRADFRSHRSRSVGPTRPTPRSSSACSLREWTPTACRKAQSRNSQA